MSPRPGPPLTAMLSVVPYFRSRGGSAPVGEAARDLGLTVPQLREVLWQLWMCGLPGYGPGDLIDLSFSAEDLDEADQVEVTFAAGMDRPLRLTWAEAVTLETGLTVFLDHPEIVDQDALRELMALLRSATGLPDQPGPGQDEGGGVRTAARTAETPPGQGAGDETAAIVRRAVEEGLALRLTYHSASSDTSRTRVVDPVGLSVASGHSYLRGIDRESGQWRTLRIDRMADVETVGPRRPTGPEPEEGSTESAPPHTARARLTASARWFLDEFPFTDPEPGPGGEVRVGIGYHDREWLVRFLLGHADVLTPDDPGLRAEIAARARDALAVQREAGEPTEPTGDNGG